MTKNVHFGNRRANSKHKQSITDSFWMLNKAVAIFKPKFYFRYEMMDQHQSAGRPCPIP